MGGRGRRHAASLEAEGNLRILPSAQSAHHSNVENHIMGKELCSRRPITDPLFPNQEAGVRSLHPVIHGLVGSV